MKQNWAMRTDNKKEKKFKTKKMYGVKKNKYNFMV